MRSVCQLPLNRFPNGNTRKSGGLSASQDYKYAILRSWSSHAACVASLRQESISEPITFSHTHDFFFFASCCISVSFILFPPSFVIFLRLLRGRFGTPAVMITFIPILFPSPFIIRSSSSMVKISLVRSQASLFHRPIVPLSSRKNKFSLCHVWPGRLLFKVRGLKKVSTHLVLGNPQPSTVLAFCGRLRNGLQ